jgi:hypothetical protein
MANTKADKKPDIKAVAADRGERTALMEPLVLSEGSRHRPGLTDLAVELAQRSTGFRRSLPESLLSSLATLVRSMNCYYSNLIEGHDTHPVDIERALQGDYSRDHPGGGGGASPAGVDSPVPRRQRPRRAAYVACNPVGGARHRRSLVRRARPRP